MDAPFNQQLLTEASRIGDQLLKQAVLQEAGLSWQSIKHQDGVARWQEQESVYGGMCGIIVFLLELHKQTGQVKYLGAAEAGMRRVLNNSNYGTDSYYALLTGRLSVPFTLLKLFEATSKRQYLIDALRITRLFDPGVHGPKLYEYINGLSGTLLGLLHVHAATQEKWLLDLIDTCIGRLLDQAHHGKQGLYWDRLYMNTHGLCGFSHGSSGIGYVFLELGRYFNNPAFYWVAEQAFQYEAQFFRADANNWTDWRRSLTKEKDEEEFKKAYCENDWAFFTRISLMNAWCHGAAGIGLARLRAYELLASPGYRREAEAAIRCTIATDVTAREVNSFTLCHGSGGNAELFLEAFRVLGEERYLAAAKTIADRAIQTRKHDGYYTSGIKHVGEDTSLFLGNAGIGYFYLRLLQPLSTPSILAPRVTSVAASIDTGACCNISADLPAVQQRILRLRYPQTLHLLKESMPEPVEACLTRCLPTGPLDSGAWQRFLQFQLSLLPEPHQTVVTDVFNLELAKCRLDEAVASDALLYYKDQMKQEDSRRIIALDPETFAAQVLVVDGDLVITQTEWDWSGVGSQQSVANCDLTAGQYYVLLRPTLRGVLEEPLSPLAATVLDAFAESKSVQMVVDEILTPLRDLPPAQQSEIAAAITQQIRQAVQSGLLLDPERHPINRHQPVPVLSESI